MFFPEYFDKYCYELLNTKCLTNNPWDQLKQYCELNTISIIFANIVKKIT